jgi:DNA repair exonuclease SbcCD nuclease subunit
MAYRMCFISDIHFGRKNNSEKYLEIIENFFFKTLSKVVKDYKITDVRILGDLFENRNSLNVRTLNGVLSVFRWYQKEFPSLKFTVLVGNHDQYYHNRIDVNSIEAIREFTNVQVIDKVSEETINGKKVIMFPWISPESEAEVKFKSVTTGSIKYDLCLGHFEIKGFEMQRGFPSEHGMEQGTFKNFKRVFTGHFHIRNTSADGKISYLGCPYQMDWGDYGNEKGIHIYDLETNETTFIQNDDSPKFVKISTEDFASKNVEKIKLAKGNFTKLIIERKVPEATLIKLIQKVESLTPLNLEIDNQVIDDIAESEEAKQLIEQYQNSVGKASDSKSFMAEYVNNVLIADETIDKNIIRSILEELHSLTARDNDG